MKKTWIKLLKWIMKQKSITTMGFIVIGLIFFGYFLCKKDINLNTALRIYNDFMKVEMIIEPVKSDSTFVNDTIRVVNESN